jgi:CBS domain-containing protein
VVDDEGRCVGVLSSSDFLHWVEKDASKRTLSAPPESVCHSWKIFGNEPAPTDSVAQHMTSDPVMTAAGTSLGKLAQMMIDADIHRVVVVDSGERPIGIISSIDILGALAREAQASHPVHDEPEGIEPYLVG